MASPSRERDSLGTSFSAGSGHSFWLEKAYLIRSMNQIHPPMTYVQSNSFSQALSSARPKQYSILSWRRSFRAFPWFDCTYTWSWRQTTSQLRQLRARPNYAWRGKMTRMIGLMTCILLICFSPNQFFFIFATAGKATIDSVLHHYIVFLAFTTICANPFIYGLNNADYRQRCRRVLFSIMSQTARGGHQCCSEGNKSWACKIRITCPGRKKYNRHAVNLDCY